MPDRPPILINLVVIPALVALVPEEMDGRVLDPAPLLLRLDVAQAVRLVPAGGKRVERDLAADGVRQAEAGELGLDRLDHGGAHLVLAVVLDERGALGRAGVAADGADVDHAVAELDEGAALDGYIERGHVRQDPVDQLLVARLADPLDEAGRRQRPAQPERRQPVLREAEVEQRGDRQRGRAQLLLLLGKVRAADEADGTLVAQGGEDGEHSRGDVLSGR